MSDQICDICGKNKATHTVKNTTPASVYHSAHRSRVDRSPYLFCPQCLDTLKPGQDPRLYARGFRKTITLIASQAKPIEEDDRACGGDRCVGACSCPPCVDGGE